MWFEDDAELATGSEYKNRVGFDQSLVIDNYLVGVAERTVGFSGGGWMDGLLGYVTCRIAYQYWTEWHFFQAGSAKHIFR